MDKEELSYIICGEFEEFISDIKVDIKNQGLDYWYINIIFDVGEYEFVLDLNTKTSYDGNLFIKEDYMNRGYGRRFVQGRELICKNIGIEKIIINHNDNISFWSHMGYSQLLNDDILFIKKQAYSVLDPVYKLLD